MVVAWERIECDPSDTHKEPPLLCISAAERSICNQIALEFAPILTRTIRAEL